MPSLGNQEYIRDMNSRIVLGQIIRQEPVSRAALAKTLGLTKATVSSIVQTFIDQEYVVEIGSLNTGKGRKPILLKFNGDCAYTLSVYLSVDSTFILICNLRGENRQFFSYPPAGPHPQKRLCQYIRLAANCCPPSRYGIVGITIGILGIVHNNRIQFTPYYDLDSPDLARQIQEEFKIPVRLENEANLSALGERTFFHNHPSLISLNIHTGIGMGIILDNRLYTGQFGYAGEFGHTIIEPGGKPCPCGNRGCIEQYASLRAIVDMYRQAIKNPTADASDLCQAYLEHQPQARACVETFIKYMSIALNNILNIFNPDMIIISSILTEKIPGLIREIEQHMSNTFNRNCCFVAASHSQETSILLGGACLAAKNFLKVSDLQFCKTSNETAPDSGAAAPFS